VLAIKSALIDVTKFEGGNSMKKYIVSLIMAIMLFVTLPFAAASETYGQTHRRVHRRTHAAYYYKKPNFYRRHRKAINIAGGAGAGALIGGLIGGRKGVAIGGLAGAGGGYLVTKKQHSKHHYTRHRIYHY